MGYMEAALGEKLDYCVGAELGFSRNKFKGNKHMLAALVEEVGELSQALIDCDRGKQTPQQVYAEVVQVIAMATRIAQEGDEAFNYKYDEVCYREFDVNKS